MEKKYCPKCKRNLLIINFSRNRSRYSGYNNYCRECFSFVNRLSNKRNRLRVVKNHKEWREANKVKINAKRRVSWNKYKSDFPTFIQYLHKRMRQRVYYSDNYKGLPICSKEEFIEVAKNSQKLKELFDRWVESGNRLHIKPSVDRIDNNKGYTLDNIQFMTWMENTLKS